MAGEKRTQDQEETLLSQTVILVDIEGTTTSISFVKETLFPYVRENLKKYVDSKWDDEEFKQDLEKLKEQAKKDEEDKVEGFVSIAGATTEEEKESLIKNVLWQMDCDRKTGALKQLQGHMWREAYTSGAVKGHVYEDVPKALESWTNDGRKVYVYSSGSVEAQKLLFGHTESGDLLKYFSDYFDTEVGAKQESSSYKNILTKIGVEASSVIFLTDIIKEAKAAKQAGLAAMIVVREGNAAITDEERENFATVKSFLDLTFQASSKRQKLDTSNAKENGDKVTADVSESMDTTEDVEMSDVSEKKAEKEEPKEGTDTEPEKKDKQESETTSASADEPMITDAKEKATQNDEAEQAETQASNSEVSKPVESSGTVQPATIDNATSKAPAKNDSAASDKPAEKAAEGEKVTDSAEALDVDKSEPKSKTETPPAESNTAEVAKSPAEEKSSDATTVTKDTESTSQQKSSDNKTEEKPSESEKTDNKTESKEESSEKPAVQSSTVESEETSGKVTQEPAKAEESSKADATENGDVPMTNEEKVAAPRITESETKESAATLAGEEKPEVTEAKSPKPKESEAAATSDTSNTEKSDSNADTGKPETKEELVKEETVVDEVNDKSTVDGEKKKLNGTTQNGDSEVSDDKLHSNGLNEGSSSEKVNSTASENTTAQNGEPESSSEASAESIKVKKVVDSTVTDGAGEPDVVPPVVVAATS